jgi:hypothetical protein
MRSSTRVMKHMQTQATAVAETLDESTTAKILQSLLLEVAENY